LKKNYIILPLVTVINVQKHCEFKSFSNYVVHCIANKLNAQEYWCLPMIISHISTIAKTF